MSIKVGKSFKALIAAGAALVMAGVHGRMRSVGRHPERSEVL